MIKNKSLIISDSSQIIRLFNIGNIKGDSFKFPPNNMAHSHWTKRKTKNYTRIASASSIWHSNTTHCKIKHTIPALLRLVCVADGLAFAQHGFLQLHGQWVFRHVERSHSAVVLVNHARPGVLLQGLVVGLSLGQYIHALVITPLQFGKLQPEEKLTIFKGDVRECGFEWGFEQSFSNNFTIIITRE